VHKNLLLEKSTVFKKMFTGGFVEATTNAATLPEDDPDAFEAVVEWIYHGKFLTINGHRTICGSQMRLLLDICRLASKYSMWELLDRATTGYVQSMSLSGCLPNRPHIDLVYEHLPPHSKLRLFVAKSVAYIILTSPNDEANGAWENKEFQALFLKHEDLLLDVLDLLRMQAGKWPLNPKGAPHCEYHEHAKAMKCPWKRKRDEDGEDWDMEPQLSPQRKKWVCRVF